MFARALCVLCVLSTLSLAQDCDEDRNELHISSDLTVDRFYDWDLCDTFIEPGVTVTLVDGGYINGNPRFSGNSNIEMEGGYIQSMSVGDAGFPWGTIESGESGALTLINREQQSVISGGTHERVAGGNLLITGGSIGELTAQDFVSLAGGSVDVLREGYLFWSGGTLHDLGGEHSVIIVDGTDLLFSERRLTGTLLDGTKVDQAFPLGDVILAGEGLIPGDADRDGLVGLGDLNGIRNHLGEYGASRWDVDFNGSVQLPDLNMVRNNFGSSLQNPVPEPSSLILSCSLLLLCKIGHCRKHTRAAT